jgi:hypothetical protein
MSRRGSTVYGINEVLAPPDLEQRAYINNYITYRIKLEFRSTEINTSDVVIKDRVQSGSLVGSGRRGESTGTGGAGKNGDRNLHGER